MLLLTLSIPASANLRLPIRNVSALATGAAVLAVAAIAAPNAAFSATTPEWRAAREALSGCRRLTDRNARLDCQDAAIAALDDADRKGEGPVVTVEQKRQVERQVFGLHPASPIRAKKEERETVSRVTVQLARAGQDSSGAWVMTTTDGAVWRQTDGTYLVNPPKAGSSLTARPGALGSFFCLIDGRREVRCKRLR